MVAWSEKPPPIFGSDADISRMRSSGMMRRVSPCVPPLKVRVLL